MVEIQGFCDPAFSRVRDQFRLNFDERGDVGTYERAQALIDAAYLSLGYRSKASGGWI